MELAISQLAGALIDMRQAGACAAAPAAAHVPPPRPRAPQAADNNRLAKMSSACLSIELRRFLRLITCARRRLPSRKGDVSRQPARLIRSARQSQLSAGQPFVSLGETRVRSGAQSSAAAWRRAAAAAAAKSESFGRSAVSRRRQSWRLSLSLERL